MHTKRILAGGALAGLILLCIGAVSWLHFYQNQASEPDATATIGNSTSSPVGGAPMSQRIQVSLSANGVTYQLRMEAGQSVLDMMQALASSTPFRFTSVYYSGLGYFIDSIGGVRGGDGSYWTLYVGGKQASLGPSSLIVREGDVIEWKLEKAGQ